jgi:hypothetical protein
MIELAKLTSGRRRRGLPRFPGRHSPARPRGLPSAIFCDTYADATRAQLHNDRTVPGIDDASTGGERDGIERAPLPETEHPVVIVTGE